MSSTRWISRTAIAFVHAEDPGYATYARELTDIAVTGSGERTDLGAVTLGVVPVTVTNTVVGYLRRRLSGEVIDFVELDLPPRTLPTVAVMYTMTPEALARSGIDPLRIPGSLHAAEHAAIGLLPLVASCDRGDIGGLSTAIGPDGLPTVFVYDGHPGGAGFAERGYRAGQDLAGRDGGRHRGLRVPARMPVLCAVTEVRQRQRSPRQGGGDRGAAHGA